MVREASNTGVESTCRDIQETVDDWRALLSRHGSGSLDLAAMIEQERLARRIELLANVLWDALETEAVHVLVPSDALCRRAQAAPRGTSLTPPDVPAALDALEQAVLLLLRAARCVRRRQFERAGTLGNHA